MATPDRDAARAQWLAQVAVIRKTQRRMTRALVQAYMAGVALWRDQALISIPKREQAGITAVLSQMWFDGGIAGGRGVMDGDKSSFPGIETKADEITLFERIMLEFVRQFGAARVQQILDTTRDQLARMIEKGIKEGLGQEAIAKLISEQMPIIAKTRARVIARTEVHTAALYSSQEVAKTSPFPMNKRWVSVFDHRTRDFGEGDGIADQANHRVMNEVTVGPGESFGVPNAFGGIDVMTGPGDPAAPAYQVINCRCSLIYRRVGRPWPKEGEA